MLCLNLVCITTALRMICMYLVPPCAVCLPLRISALSKEKLSVYLDKEINHPITVLEMSVGFQEVETCRLQDNQHTKVVRLLALRNDRLNAWKYSWFSFILNAESPPRLGGLCK
jgi:hypothetical protein